MAKKAMAVALEDEAAMIAEAAYFRSEQRGFAPGGELDDWVAAEREIAAILAAARAPAAAVRKARKKAAGEPTAAKAAARSKVAAKRVARKQPIKKKAELDNDN